MNYLIDTHILIWHAENNPALKPAVLALLDDLNNQIFVSHASLWEISIKTSLGKLHLGFPVSHLAVGLEKNGFSLLPFDFRHYEALSTMPFHHNDPFDRMIIAQAQTEQFEVITHDEKFGLYPVRVVWS